MRTRENICTAPAQRLLTRVPIITIKSSFQGGHGPASPPWTHFLTVLLLPEHCRPAPALGPLLLPSLPPGPCTVAGTLTPSAQASPGVPFAFCRRGPSTACAHPGVVHCPNPTRAQARCRQRSRSVLLPLGCPALENGPWHQVNTA